MSAVAVAIGGGALINYISQQNAAGTAADAQRDAANASSGTQMAMYNQTRSDLAPYRAAGVGALDSLTSELPDLSRQFTAADFQEDPGYQFSLEEGQKAIQRSAAARGLLNSTSTMKDLSKYTTGMADQQFSTAADRFSANQQKRYNMLSGVASGGQGAINQVANTGQNAANNISANQTAVGNANAAQAIAGANNMSNLMGQGMNTWMNYTMMNRAFPQTGS